MTESWITESLWEITKWRELSQAEVEQLPPHRLDELAPMYLLGGGCTLLSHAACYGQLQTITALKILGADLDVGNHSGERAIHRACARGELEVVRFLCNNGASINVQNNHNFTTKSLPSLLVLS